MTVQWYKTFYEHDADSMYDFTMAQISEYTQLAQEREKEWAGA